ncbi:hypothetical protein [Lapidilactobacillus luobeiensis]|uniref:hypothetical protein n=1 Tax=Lapidilactobacillus luobeiensis TaxID=2950371 RepID=UPI0021C3FC7E|nr:hypothetical protein [Lapidilactobacillus luobeiensis]
MSSLIYLSSPYLIFILLWLIVVLISKHNTRNFQRYMMKKYNWSISKFISQERLQQDAAMSVIPFFIKAILIAFILATITIFIISLSLLFINFPNYSGAYSLITTDLGLNLIFIGPLIFYVEKKKSPYRGEFPEFDNKKGTPLFTSLVPTIINLISLFLFILIRIRH